MTPLVAPSPLIKPVTAPRPVPGEARGDGSQARFVVLEEAPAAQVPPTAAALAAMTAMGGKAAVAGRMQARRLARKRVEDEDKPASDEAEKTAAAKDDLPPILPLIGRPRIDLEAEMEAVRKARKSQRGVGPLTAFLAQHIGQDGSFGASLRAPLKWLISAYMRHQAPETPAPKRQTLTVS